MNFTAKGYLFILRTKWEGRVFNITLWKESKFRINKVNDPDDWALETKKALGAKTYYNLPGGIKFFDREKYKRNDIEVKFIKLDLKEYDQKRNVFESGLSIIDVMMFNSIEKINAMLNQYELI